MENLEDAKFTVGEAAREAGVTAETLRHYDRIGLVKPSMRDPASRYRYYTPADIIVLKTVHALQLMDMPLAEIGDILRCDDLGAVVSLFREAEKRADEKIAALEDSKARIGRARDSYERSMARDTVSADGLITCPPRTILLSPTLEQPSLNNLWSYLHHFYELLPPAERQAAEFEDLAGILHWQGKSRMFAVCRRCQAAGQLYRIPGGRYLTAVCSETSRSETLDRLQETARTRYGIDPTFSVEIVVITGILHWSYEACVCLEEDGIAPAFGATEPAPRCDDAEHA